MRELFEQASAPVADFGGSEEEFAFDGPVGAVGRLRGGLEGGFAIKRIAEPVVLARAL